MRRRLDSPEKEEATADFPLAHLQGLLGAEKVSGILLQLTLYEYEPLVNVALVPGTCLSQWPLHFFGMACWM